MAVRNCRIQGQGLTSGLEGGGKPMIDCIDHEIKLSRNITLQPRQATKSMGMVKLPVLSK